MNQSHLDSEVTFYLAGCPEDLTNRAQNIETKTSEMVVKSDISCERCGGSFLSERKLRNHQKKCGSLCEDEVSIALHDDQIEGKPVLSSSRIGNSATTTIHLSTDNKFVCEVCSEEFRSLHKFANHLQEQNHFVKEDWPERGDEFTSDECPSESAVSNSEKINGYDPPKPHACGICGKRFRFKVSLTRHIKSVHGNEKRFTCALCSKMFFEKSNLLKHFSVHTGDRPFSCELCPKQFRQASGMRLHMKIHTNEDRFVCEICDRSFPAETSLKKHVERHNTVLEFKCSTCLMTFSTNSTYKKHLLTHTGDRAFACSMCEKRFYHKGHLTEHLRVHTGEKPFECKQCEKRFAQRTALTQHNARFHMNGKPFSCDLCGEAFARKCDVKAHKITTKCA